MAELDSKHEKPRTPASETPTSGQRLFAQWHNYLKENQTLPSHGGQIQALAEFQDRQWPLDSETGRLIDTGTPDKPQKIALVRGSNRYYQIYSQASWYKYLAEFRRTDRPLAPDPLKNSHYIDYVTEVILITACEFLRLGFRPTQAQWDDIANHQSERATAFKPPIPATKKALDAQRAKCIQARSAYERELSILDLNHSDDRSTFNYHYALEIRNQFPRFRPLAVDADPEDIRTLEIDDENYLEANYYSIIFQRNIPPSLDRIRTQNAAKKLMALEQAEMHLAIMEACPAPRVSQALSSEKIIKNPQEIKKQIDKASKVMAENLDKAYNKPIDQAAISSAINYGRALAKEAVAKPVTPVEAIARMRAYKNALRHPVNLAKKSFFQTQIFSQSALAAIKVGQCQIELEDLEKQLMVAMPASPAARSSHLYTMTQLERKRQETRQFATSENQQSSTESLSQSDQPTNKDSAPESPATLEKHPLFQPEPALPQHAELSAAPTTETEEETTISWTL